MHKATTDVCGYSNSTGSTARNCAVLRCNLALAKLMLRQGATGRNAFLKTLSELVEG